MTDTFRPTRPFHVPASLRELNGPTTSGRVRLPLHLEWSGGREYDLDDPADRARVYELVLREGTSEDLHTYLDAGLLAEAFDRMFLPQPIEQAWRSLLANSPTDAGR